MPAIAISLLLAAAMFATIWMVLSRISARHIRSQRSALPGQLSAAERRRLYKTLDIDPAALARQRRSNVLWLDPRVIDRRTDA